MIESGFIGAFMKTLLFFIAISSFFAGLANAEMKWVGSGTIDARPSIGGRIGIQEPIQIEPRFPRNGGTRVGIEVPIEVPPSYGGRVEIQPPAFPSPPIFERPSFPRYPRYPRVPRCERRLEITSQDGIEIRRTRRYCGRAHRHWDDVPVRYEIRDEEPEIEVTYPRIERRSEVRIDLDAPLIGEIIGNILNAGFSARWN